MSDPGNPHNRNIGGAVLTLAATATASTVVNAIRTKVVAANLGPSWFGLYGTLLSFTTLAGAVCGLGVESVATREIAKHNARQERDRVNRIVSSVQTMPLYVGLVGGIVVALIAALRRWGEQSLSHFLVGAGLLSVPFLVLTGVLRSSLIGLQRTRTVGQTAIVGSTVALVLCLPLVWLDPQLGAAVALLSVPVGSALVFVLAARMENLPRPKFDLASVLTVLGMAKAGLVFALASYLPFLTQFLCQVIMMEKVGAERVGFYVAGYALAGAYLAGLLSTFSTAVLPDMSSQIQQGANMDDYFREQLRIYSTLMLPAVFVIQAVAPWLLRLLFSEDYVAAAPIFRWIVIGDILRPFGWIFGNALFVTRKSSVFLLFHFSIFVGAVVSFWLALSLAPEYHGIEGLAAFISSVVGFGISVWIAQVLLGVGWRSRFNLVALLTCAAGVSFEVLLPFCEMSNSLIIILRLVTGLILLPPAVRLVRVFLFEHSAFSEKGDGAQ